MKRLAPIVAIVVVTVWAHASQPRLSAGGGTGWDGWSYATMARRYAGQSVPPWQFGEVSSPFRERIGAPLLVSVVMRVTGLDVVPAFMVVNTAAAGVAAWFFYLWLSESGVPLPWLGLLLFCTQWIAPIRYTAWYPTLTDPLGWSLFSMGLLGLERTQQGRRSGVVLLVAALFAGTLVRETGVLLWTGTLAFTRRPRGRRLCLALAVLTAAAYALAAGDALFAQAQHLDRRLEMGSTRLDLSWVAFAMAFGPVITVVPVGIAETARHFGRHVYQLPLFLVLAAIVLSGPAEERVYFWLAPFVYEAVLFAIAELRLWQSRAFELILALAIAQSLAARRWWTIPDFPALGQTAPIVWLTPWGSTGFFGDLTAWWATPAALATIKEQYLITFAALAFLTACQVLRLRRAGA